MLCLIPAKGNSSRLPMKNILPIDGKPLLQHVIEKAKSSKVFLDICVSTENDDIAELALNLKVNEVITRPKRLSVDPATVIDVMIHALGALKESGKSYDYICTLLPTSPLLKVSDIVKASNLFLKDSGKVLLSVTQTDYPPYNAYLIDSDTNLLEPCFPDSDFKYSKSTECPLTYKCNGMILITDVKRLIKNGTYRNQKIIPFIIPQDRSIDIDTKIEYLFAKFLIESKYSKAKL